MASTRSAGACPSPRAPCSYGRPFPSPSAPSRPSPPADGAASSPSASAMNEIKIGLLGLGTVGSGVVKVLQTHGTEMEERAGCRLRLQVVADADTLRPREG